MKYTLYHSNLLATVYYQSTLEKQTSTNLASL